MGKNNCSNSRNLMKLKTIQIYRGFIALVIATSHAIEVLNHYGFPGLNFLKLRTGGVDFFFTLSGFIIFYVFSKYHKDSTAVRFFLLKRFLRIYPLVWFFTLISLPVYFFYPSIGAGNETEFLVILNSLFLFPQSTAPVLGATWSLSHIVLFYIIFHFYLIRPKLVLWLLMSWLTIFIVGFVRAEGDHEKILNSTIINFIFSPFNLEFLVGTLLASYVLNKKNNHGFLTIFVGLGIFVIGWVFLEKKSSSGLVALTFCLASTLMILGGVGIDKKFVLTIPKSLDILGAASYAIIIVNLPIIVLFALLSSKLFDVSQTPVWLSFIYVGLSAMLATAGGIFSCKFIEPFLLLIIEKILRKNIVLKSSG